MEEKEYLSYYGEEIKLKSLSYPEVIEVLKRGPPPQRDILWNSFE
jgi:hypothetical protein